MRTAQADYDAIFRALCPQEAETVRRLAAAKGADEWLKEPLCRAVATALAVGNLFAAAYEDGADDREAIRRIAAQLDLDFETLCRQRRRYRRKRSARRTNDPPDPAGQ